MLLNMRDKETGNLVSLDVLDVDMALSVTQNGNQYFVSVNKKYRTDDTFDTKEEAENRLKEISSLRNELENELRAYV